MPQGWRHQALGAAALALALAAVGLMGGCANIQAPLSDQQAQDRPLTGRLSVRVDAANTADKKSLSANFELSGNAQHGLLVLQTPLGTTLAQARWQPAQATLNTPQGRSTYPDMAALTKQLLGEEIPVAALFSWLHGQPWPGADSVASQSPAPAGFSQLGWNVDLTRFASASLMVARRLQAPAVSVQVQLE